MTCYGLQTSSPSSDRSHVLAVLELIIGCDAIVEGNDALVDSDINKNNTQWKLDDTIGYIKEQLSHDMDLQDIDA
ncbi:hypothetical protein BGZ65_004267, partial [Modicella reniformis]